MLRRSAWLLSLATVSTLSWASSALAQWPSNGVYINDHAYGNRIRERAVSDGRNGMIVAWEIEYPSNDMGIYAARVDASGAVSWAITVRSSGNLCTDVDLAPDGLGGANLVWREHFSSTDYDIMGNHISITGALGPSPLTICNAAGPQSYPRIVGSIGSTAIVTWQDQRNGGIPDIYAQRWYVGGMYWTANGVAICIATGTQEYPRIVSDGADGAIIAWDDLRSGQPKPYVQRVNVSGTTLWTANGVSACGNVGTSHRMGAMVSDGAGGAILSWDDDRNSFVSGWDIYAQRLNASGTLQWGANGAVVTNAGGDQNGSTLALNPDGGAWVVWTDQRNSAQGDIYMDQLSSTGSGTSSDYEVCTATGSQTNSKCIADANGRVLIAWDDLRAGSGDVYVQRMTALPEWTTNGVAVASAAGNQGSPAIVSDLAGGALVAWLEDFQNGDHVHAGRVTAAGTPNPQTFFQTDGFPISTGTGVVGRPVTLADPVGGFYVTWSDTKTGAGDIYLKHLNNAGFVDGYWPVDGFNLSNNGSLQENPVIAAGPLWVMVAWEDSRNGNKDIYAQWVRRSDAAPFTSPPSVCTATGDQTQPSIASDDQGENFFLSWTDGRAGGSNLDIYGQLVTYSGGIGWGANGTAISTATGNQTDARVVWDKVTGFLNAGAIITWRGSGIYGQRLNNSGSKLWGANGVTIESAAAAAGPTMVPDGSGGAMVEYRMGSPAAVYVRRVDANGAFPSGWTSSVRISPLTQSSSVSMAQEGTSGSLVSWLEQVGSTYTVRVNRIGTGGAIASGWPTTGVALRSGTTVATPSLCRDGVGGAVVAWYENGDIRASRVVFRGWIDPNYPTSGAVLCGATQTQDQPSAVLLAAGSAAVVWRDGRTGAMAELYSGKTSFDVTGPAQVTNVFASDGCETIHVSWTAPADDGSQPVMGYELVRWPGGQLVPTGTPQNPGTSEDIGDYLGFCSGSMFYTVSSYDECGNWSPTSNYSNSASTRCPPDFCMDESEPASVMTLTPGLARPEPNPALDQVKLRYVVPEDQGGQPLQLSVFDLLGRRVATVKHGIAQPGDIQIHWDLRDESGAKLRGGVYFLRLTIGSLRFDQVLVTTR
jgi:hypothetical protein